MVDEGRQPVAGARVRSLDSVPRQVVITGADGTFELPPERPYLSQIRIIATADGGARQGMLLYERPTRPDDPGPKAGIMLHPAHEVTLTVVDGRGAPVPDAAVFLLDLGSPAAEARTDRRGIAVLRGPTGLRTLWIVAAKPGVGFDYFENYQTETHLDFSPTPREARLVLNGALPKVRVRVVDSAGRPVPGLKIYPLTVEKKGKYRFANFAPLPLDPLTDADGIAAFDWLPADIRSAEFHAASQDYWLPGPCTLDPGKPDALLTARALRPTMVSGKVTFPDGSPAPGIEVRAKGSGGPGIPQGREFFARATTAGDGSYEMLLMPEQTYTIKAVGGEGVGPGPGDVAVQPPTPPPPPPPDGAGPGPGGVEVREGVPRTGIDLVLPRGAADPGRANPGGGSRP